MTFEEAVNLARDINKRFEKIEGKPWGIEGSMIEMNKQLGQLAAFIMVTEKYYPQGREDEDKQYQASKENIADELADILFMTMRIADHYGIDLEEAHKKALENADKYLTSKGA
jgi:NTP pyrophosphatase (non-canonical NTP hydrolase)